MSNCSNHRKDLMGQTDMQHIAQDIGNLHYETLGYMLNYLSKKLKEDSRKDWQAGRIQIANRLKLASQHIKDARIQIQEAWQISKPFMENQNPEP